VGSWVAFFGWIPLYLSWRKENPEKVKLQQKRSYSKPERIIRNRQTKKK
jgi:hypothetical protein